MYILFHVQCCHRFVDHTATSEDSLVEWARKQAACWLGKCVSDKQKEETPWQAWLRSRVEILDPDVTLTQWVAKNGLLPDGVHTRKVSRWELIVLRALYAPLFLLSARTCQKHCVLQWASGAPRRLDSGHAPARRRRGGEKIAFHDEECARDRVHPGPVADASGGQGVHTTHTPN